MTTIGIVLFPQLTQLNLTGPYEVFCQMPDITFALTTPKVASQMIFASDSA